MTGGTRRTPPELEGRPHAQSTHRRRARRTGRHGGQRLWNGRRLPATGSGPGPGRTCRRRTGGPGAAPVNVVGLVGGTSLVNFSTDDLAVQDNRTVTGLGGRRQAGRHRLPGAGRQALRRRRRRRHLHARRGRRGHQGQAADASSSTGRTSASTSTRPRTRCGSSATPGRTCASRSPTPAAPTAERQGADQPGRPAGHRHRPRAGRDQRRLHEQRRGQRHRHRAVRARHEGRPACRSSPRPTPAPSPRWARWAWTPGRRRASTSTARPTASPAEVTALATLQVGGTLRPVPDRPAHRQGRVARRADREGHRHRRAARPA